MSEPPVRILSLDGGGIRGIVAATVLAALEERTERPVARSFDLIAGTSTGGLLALGLTRPGPDGQPRWSAQKLIDLYEREGPRIFSRPLLHRLLSLESLIDEKYPDGGLEKVLEEQLGEARLSQALTDVLVTAYALEDRRPFFFKSARARTDPARDFPMRVAARATAAAPTYFEPLLLESLDGGSPGGLIDGGVFANNPAMCAYAEAVRESPGREMLLVSIGTGEATRPISHHSASGWGLIEWARPILDVVFDGVSDATDYHLRQVLGEGRYWRFQTRLEEASDDLDDAGAENIGALKREGERLVAERSAELDRVAELVAGS